MKNPIFDKLNDFFNGDLGVIREFADQIIFSEHDVKHNCKENSDDLFDGVADSVIAVHTGISVVKELHELDNEDINEYLLDEYNLSMSQLDYLYLSLDLNEFTFKSVKNYKNNREG